MAHPSRYHYAGINAAYALIGLAFLVSACASPTLSTPQVSKEELDREQAIQRQLVEQNRVAYAPAAAYSPQQMLERLYVVAPYVAAAGQAICESVRTDPANSCTYNFVLEESDVANAYADGNEVTITTAMMTIPQNDEELAFILSHEYAHNILSHVNASQQNAATGSLLGGLMDVFAASKGYDTGSTFQNVGGEIGQEAYSVEFEREADYLGLYVLHQTGYDIRVAPQVWRRMSVDNPEAIYLSTSHPTNPDRYVAMEKTIGEILYKKNTGAAITPNRRG